MKFFYLLVISSILSQPLFAQYGPVRQSPYETSWVDGAISAAGVGLSYWGLRLMMKKKAVTEEELQWMDANPEAARADIPFFDRWAIDFYVPEARANQISDIPFYASFGLPFLFLADERTRSDAGQIGLLYLETMAITGALFAQVNGRVNRKRPNVYSPEASMEIRRDDKSQNSFYGGHITATAAATFFTAKVFNDYFPDSPAKPYVWAGAAAVPALVGYYRMRAGKHFLSDNLIGYAIGAGVGILVPHLHKEVENLSLSPGQTLQGASTIRFRYRF
ncbi:phosphatase PAP2 family protein [Nafulsella turpanensis]|uniref:phosphatase PAP2 family protein n=1 Tax=Nafulsella turpanensis TaxID=1265690 RepID=UPI0003490FE7|nr:phosphatase PAP2 family protein [Nafulsella turpanensis]